MNTSCQIHPIDIYHITIPRYQTQNESALALLEKRATVLRHTCAQF